ncbi:centromere protein V-like [Liolophura sinensis]|uniref:centromere protein V-like n=1 Tax=Liolophura sinensis TaxID=3198878 RepID=UPI00315960F8
MSVSDSDVVRHSGGCHCGRVQFEVWAPAILKVIKCNCTICTMKQNHHFIVPESRFRLIEGAENLTTYTFNTHKAKHMFCKTCGIQSFYRPRSNPDGYGVMPHCLVPGTVDKTEYESFDGREWESSMAKHPSISERSKLPE